MVVSLFYCSTAVSGFILTRSRNPMPSLQDTTHEAAHGRPLAFLLPEFRVPGLRRPGWEKPRRLRSLRQEHADPLSPLSLLAASARPSGSGGPPRHRDPLQPQVRGSCEGGPRRVGRDSPLTCQAQFDEKWSFVFKKQAHCDPEDPADDQNGDWWDHVWSLSEWIRFPVMLRS